MLRRPQRPHAPSGHLRSCGARFADAAISNTPARRPYRACLMSGQRPRSNGVGFRPVRQVRGRNFPPRWLPDRPTRGNGTSSRRGTWAKSSVNDGDSLRLLQDRPELGNSDRRGPQVHCREEHGRKAVAAVPSPGSSPYSPELFFLHEHFTDITIPPNVPAWPPTEPAHYHGMIRSPDDESPGLLGLGRRCRRHDRGLSPLIHSQASAARALKAKRRPH